MDIQSVISTGLIAPGAMLITENQKKSTAQQWYDALAQHH